VRLSTASSSTLGQVESAAVHRVRERTRERWFAVAMTIVLCALVLRGFWPSYFGPLLTGRPTVRPLVMHLHGVVFSGWMLLLVVQVLLIARRRVALHRTLGLISIGYAVLLIGLGLWVSFSAPVAHVRAGEWSVDQAASFLLLPLVDMVLFAGFFSAAVVYRRRPDYHKRLMFAATLAIVFAAVGRMFDSSLAGFFAVWLSPLAGAMIFDRVTRGHVHRVYVIALAIFVAAFCRLLLMETPMWIAVGRTLLSPFL
jgi:hypothetical protein